MSDTAIVPTLPQGDLTIVRNRTFDEIAVGDSASIERTLTTQDIELFAVLSGGSTPFESMPLFVQRVMQVAPTTHFVELAQAILYRGAGVSVVWRPYLILALIGSALFALSLARFRKTISQMA